MFYLTKIKESLLKNRYGKYILIGGFTFFLVKGLIWLAVFIVVGLGLFNSFQIKIITKSIIRIKLIITEARCEYLNLPIKTQKGRPTQYYFDRQITPKIFLWPTPENSTDTLEYFYVRRIQDADTLQNTSDVPFRFLPCMVAGLSYYLSIKRAPERTQL